jgi:L-threonylcarbamoyladenylate synthase
MTEILAANPAGIARAAALLRAGALVAFGTETVYGLGADATNAHAVAAIFAAKARPHFNPLICHYPTAEAAFAQVEPTPTAHQLADAFWPGPLTLVLPRKSDCPVALLAGAGLQTLAVRVPAHETARALLRAVDCPVAAPSANRSGQISPTTAQHVMEGLGGRIAAILDSGPCHVGIESTVLDLSGDQPVLLRPGGATIEAMEARLGPVGRPIAPAEIPSAPRSPGLMLSHYAPNAPVRLNATTVRDNEALLAFGPPPNGAATVFQLSASRDPTEAAANLFTGLRELDTKVAQRHLTAIAVMPIPEQGLGLAINDRLRRAAAPRR